MVSSDTSDFTTKSEPNRNHRAREWEYPLWNSSMDYGIGSIY